MLNVTIIDTKKKPKRYFLLTLSKYLSKVEKDYMNLGVIIPTLRNYKKGRFLKRKSFKTRISISY